MGASRSGPRSILLVLAAISLLLSGLATIVGVSVNPAGAVAVTPGIDLGNFEIEGDMDVDDVVPPLLLDWAASAVNGSATFIPVIDDVGDSQFDGGMNEGNSATWTCNNGNVNDKTDLLRAYVNQRTFDNHAFVDLAWVGNKLSGNSSPELSVSLEFSQLPLAQQPAVTIPGSCALTRQIGDLLITYAYTGGNSPVTIMLFRWNGSAWTDQSLTAANVRGANNTNAAVPDLVANPNGSVSIPAERFGEATIDLTAALTPANGAPICATFGTLNIRTQQNSQNSNAFSDRLPSSAIDLSTCASVRIEKKDDQGNPVEGAVFQAFKDDGDGLFEPGPGAGADAPAAGTCTTDASGLCTMGNLIPGNYFVRELSAPTGYTAATNVIGPIVLAAQQNVVIDGTTDLNTPPDGILDGFVNFRTQWQLTLVQDESNLVNTTHTFTATLTKKTSLLGNFGGAMNETLTFAKSSGPGQITLVNGVAAPPLTCTTDVDGKCTVTIASAVAGQTKVTATFVEQGVTVTTPVTKTAEATKNWVDYRLSISPSSVNRLGTAHTFEVLLETDTTGGSFVPAGSQTVNLTWTGSRTGMTINGVAAPAAPTALTCTTNSVTGKCLVVVDSTVTGLFTLDASYDAVVGPTSATIDTDEKTKRWIDWDLAITPLSDENLVGTQHTFTVKARFDAGDGLGLVGLQNLNPAVTLAPSGVGSIVTNNCATTGTDASGECTVIITSAVAGVSTANATLNNTQQGVAVTLTAGPATKQWVAYRLSVEPDDVNRVNEQHEFTVFLETDTGSGFGPATGQTVDLSVVSSAAPEIVTINGISPPLAAPLTCVTGIGILAGKCTVVVNSAAPGTFTLDASYAAQVGDTSATINADAATERWIDWQLSIEPLDATNLVGTNHTVTVTALFNDGDDGNGSVGFQPLVGVKPTVALTGIGDVVTDNCNGVGSTGTDANGKCTVIITSAIAGLSTLNATLADTQDQITANLTAGPALKHWVAYTLTVTPNGVNRVSDAHEFTVLLRTNAGQGPVPVPGATVDLSVSGSSGSIVTINGDPAGAAPYSCTTKADGTCLVVVNSPDTGSLVLSASFEAVAGTTSATIQADSANKRWIDWQMSISPPSDSNLVDTNHTVTVRVLFDGGDGTGPVGLPGVHPTVTLAGVGSVVTNNCNGVGSAGTDANGACTVVITSAVPGLSEVSAELQDTRDGVTADLTAGPARKQWLAYRLTVAPDAVNRVGNEHTFTVLLEVNDGNGFANVGFGQTIDLTTSGIPAQIVSINDAAPGPAPHSCVTRNDGTCSVVVNSSTTGTFTLDASYHAVVGDTQADIAAGAPATKRWIDWQLAISPLTDINLVDNPHTFTVTALFDAGDGAGPVALPGVKPVVTLSGPETVVTNTCASAGTNASGQCTVTVTSDDAGVTVANATLDDVRLGVSAHLTAGPVEKQWVSYRISVTPESATHEVDTTQQYLVTLEVAHSPFVPAPGEHIDLALTGVGSIVAVDGVAVTGPDQSCTTDAAGHCTVTVTSNAVGTQHLAATFHAVVGDTSGTFSDSARKIWVAPPPVYGGDPGDTGGDDDPYGDDPGDTNDPSPFDPTTNTTTRPVTPVDIPTDVAGTPAKPEPAPAVGGTEAEQQPATQPAPDAPGGIGGLLPRTGAGIVGQAFLALLLLAGGLALIRATRRRRSSPSA